MAQNITLLGASYSDVPAVNLPKTGGGTARFTDASITTAVESDVAQGKVFVKVDGSQGIGTATGGGGTETGSVYQDADGYLVMDDGESTAPQGNISITANGTYNVADYAGATVDVVKTYTATISGTGNATYCWVQMNATGTKYYTDGDTFTYKDGDNLYFRYRGTANGATFTVNGTKVDSVSAASSKYYTLTNPRCDMTIELTYGATSNINLVLPTTSLTDNGMGQVGGYAFANVAVPGMSETELRNFIQRTTGFTDITWPSNLTSIGGYAFADCSKFNPTSLPSGIISIGTYAFRECRDLALTSLPSGITSIGTYAFSGCTNLALTSLPSGIKVIPDYAFYNCTSLALTSLPSGVTNIQLNAFRGCTNLALTSLPSDLATIAAYAFQDCTSLALTSLPSGITNIQSYTFYRCTSLALTSLPSGVVTINTCAFAGCTSITSISCDGVITTLGSSAFTGTTDNSMQLVSASFPNLAVTQNLNTAFGNSTAALACQLLEFCDIGNAVGIGAYAFANCYSLTKLVIRRTSVAALSNINAFYNTPIRGYNSLTGTIYVPSSLISSYQTATNWKTIYDAGTVTFSAIEGSEYELE